MAKTVRIVYLGPAITHQPPGWYRIEQTGNKIVYCGPFYSEASAMRWTAGQITTESDDAFAERQFTDTRAERAP